MTSVDRTLIQLIKEIIDDLSAAADMARVQAIVTTAARRLTGADGATIVYREGDFCYYADEDAISPLWKGRKFNLTDCISGWVMLNKVTAILPDIYQDERIPADAYRPTFVKSLVMTPVCTDEPVAAIGCYWSDTHAPTTTDKELLELLAGVVARTIENIQLIKHLEHQVEVRTSALRSLTVERSLQEEQQNRKIAGILHDELGSTLALAKIRTGQIRQHNKDPRLNAQLDAIQQLLHESIEFTRHLTFSLGPPILSSLGFGRALRWLAHQFFDQTGTVECRVEDIGTPVTLEPACRETLFSITRELFVNISKHAQATRVALSLHWTDSSLLLRVEDNGIGFNVAQQRECCLDSRRYGLFSVAERLAHLSGRLDIQSAVGNGTCVLIQVPVAVPEQAAS